ncbi:MAG: sulfotransferase domain-containing protein [Planctomycetota bacterium]|jgi:hypothetical protein
MIAAFGNPFVVLLAIVGSAVLLFLVQLSHLVAVLVWCERRGQGLNYYGLSPAQRLRFKTVLKRHRVLLAPTIWLLSRVTGFRFANASFSYRGVAGPKGSCSEESFARGAQYQPRAEDVFVVTQMRCGTTWMQHLVYQIVTRGSGDLVGQGRTLYAVSPWLESLKSVFVDDAPLLGSERPSRIIKTHFPTQLCPFSDAAKYVYVVRHPVSCFSSCVDFVRHSTGSFAPSVEACEAWFTSNDSMWWSTWPNHVSGWWRRSEEHANVLFVRFDEMKEDLAAVANVVAEFLGVQPLSSDELAQVMRKCSFQYMRDHEECFEMTPPHLLQKRRGQFVSGKLDRHEDLPEDVRGRVALWCRDQLASANLLKFTKLMQ